MSRGLKLGDQLVLSPKFWVGVVWRVCGYDSELGELTESDSMNPWIGC